MDNIFNYIDSQLLLFFNGMHTQWLDSFMMMATGRFVWVPMYATILFILFRTFPRRDAALYTLAIVAAIVFADQVCASLLRPIFERLRPAHPENPLSQWVQIVDGYRGGRYGFPSCHGSNSFALATILALIIRSARFSRFIFFWAALNSYTRLYLGVHYPGDLLAGALIGSAGAVGIYFLFRRIFNISAGKEESRILFAYPARILAPVTHLNVVKIRTYDIMPAVGATTILLLLLLSL